MIVIFTDFPQNLSDHMPEKVTPLPIMGSRMYWFIIVFDRSLFTPPQQNPDWADLGVLLLHA